MRTLLLTVSLGLVAALQAQDPPASGGLGQDVSGKWYLKAATADQEIPMKKPESVTSMNLTVLEGGNLEVQATILIDGQCRDKTLVLERASEPGKYTAYGGKRVVYITPSAVKDHYILYCEGELGGKQIRVAKLMGRDPENNAGALEDFKKVAEAKGLHLEVFIPRQSETCSPEA